MHPLYDPFVDNLHDLLRELRQQARNILEKHRDCTVAEFHIWPEGVHEQLEAVHIAITTAPGFIEEYDLNTDVFLSPAQARGQWCGVVHPDGAFLMSLEIEVPF